MAPAPLGCSRYGPSGGPSEGSPERHEPQSAGLSRRHRKTERGGGGGGVLMYIHEIIFIMMNSFNIKLRYRDMS